MSYVVLARKYRPRAFEEVVGQEAIAQTLQNAIRTNRVAHAYLFAGPRGVGKTSMARILAKALNCVKGPTDTPCNECEICRAVSEGDDLDVIEIDGASNRGVDDIRELRQSVKYTPNRARYKIYIIDEVHMLTREAFNALLKTLEEPPEHVKFIFATTEPRKVLETIQSRCQRFDFRRVATPQIAGRLRTICDAEGIEAEQEALETIARSVRGGMRDAQSILDQLVAFCEGKITVDAVHQVLGIVPETEVARLIDDFINHDAGDALALVHALFDEGRDVVDFLDSVNAYIRDIMVAAACGADAKLIDRSAESLQRIADQAGKLSLDTWMYMLQVFLEVKRRSRENVQSRVLLELAVLKLTRLDELRPLSDILERLQSLETRLSEGAAPAASPSPRAVSAPAGKNRPRTSTPAAEPRPASRRGEPPSPPPRRSRDAAPSQTSPAASGDAWSAVAEFVKRQSRALGAILEAGCRLGSLTQDAAVIYVQNKGHLAFVRADSARKLIAQAFESIGRPVQNLQIEPDPDADAADSSPGTSEGSKANDSKSSPRAILDNPIVKEALERFNARITGVDQG